MTENAGTSKYVEISDEDVRCARPLVSVVVLAYRHEAYLAEALSSIVTQSVDFAVEVIVAEDSSPDDTRRVAVEYQALHPSAIRVLAGGENVGMMKNLERALAACRGEFVCFCEGDDYWVDKSKLRRQVEALQANADLDICFHSTMHRSAATGKITGPHARRAFGTAKTTLQQAILTSGFMPTASVMLRRAVCASLPEWLFEEAPFADMFIYIFGSRRGGAIYLDRPMCVYRIGVPASWSVGIESLDQLMRVNRRYLTCLGYLERDLGQGRRLFDRKIMRSYGTACLDAAFAGKERNVEHALQVLRERGFVRAWDRAAVALLSQTTFRLACAWGRRTFVLTKYRVALLVNAIV